jgi:DNA helicase-2/ATP-dependent DNA helicase PcrA
MAAAAAITIARHQLHSRRQLIVVTFTRSAAVNIKAKILSHLKEWKLPVSAFAVHTLHGLAFNIASRHPNLSKLNVANTSLINPNQEHRLIRNSVDQWIANHSSLYRQLVIGTSFDGEETERLRRQSLLRTEVLPKLAYTVIREAKSSGLHPVDLRSCNTTVTQGGDNLEYEILHIAAGLYESYQTQLAKRQLIDYDDMILAALRVLEDPDARQFWQTQIFAVFEDEAQDSTPLQTRLLELLASDPQHPKHQNLIRVGDSNQAINSTFTPADPFFFESFANIVLMKTV